MNPRRLAIAFVALGAVAYVALFSIDHLVDHDEVGAPVWDGVFFTPPIAAGVAAYLWPRWPVVAAIVLAMALIPFGVYELELATGLQEPPGPACDPCVNTTIFSVLALPALVISVVTCAIARRRGRAAL